MPGILSPTNSTAGARIVALQGPSGGRGSIKSQQVVRDTDTLQADVS
jgi:hypothetical protein